MLEYHNKKVVEAQTYFLPARPSILILWRSLSVLVPQDDSNCEYQSLQLISGMC